MDAGGRVGESTLGVRLLTTEDRDEARDIAEQLSRLNEERRAIEATVQEAAEAQIASQHNRAVLVLAGRRGDPHHDQVGDDQRAARHRAAVAAALADHRC